MSLEEESFFNRQTKVPEIGIIGLRTWKDASALIIGLGGLGCPASLHLALAGVGRVGLADFDRVELSNLHRQTSFTQKDIGKLKTDVIETFLKERTPWLHIEKFNLNLTFDTDCDFFRSWDIVLDCTDTISAKYAINDFCILYSIPLVTAAVYRTSAQFGIFAGQGKPCYRCLYPNLEDGDTLNCADGGVLGVQTALAGTYQASIALKYLLKPKETETDVIYQLEWDSPLLSYSKILPNSKCISCGDVSAHFSQKEKSYEILAENYWILKSDCSVLLLDVREEEEILLNPISNAVHFPLSRLEKGEKMEHSNFKTIVCICETGIRSKRALSFLNPQTTNLSLSGGRRSLISYLVI